MRAYSYHGRRRLVRLERQFRHVDQRRSDLRRRTGNLVHVGHVSLEVLGVFVKGLPLPKELDNRFRYILSLHLLPGAQSAVQVGLFIEGEESLINIDAAHALSSLGHWGPLGFRLRAGSVLGQRDSLCPCCPLKSPFNFITLEIILFTAFCIFIMNRFFIYFIKKRTIDLEVFFKNFVMKFIED